MNFAAGSGTFSVFESRDDFVRRFDANKTALQAEGWHHTAWIATLQDEYWGIQFRSSCMPPELVQTMVDNVS